MSSRYGEVEVGLAAIPEKYHQVYDYYALGFSDKGLPGRIESGIWKEHPMYSSYLIRDYLFTYQKTKEKKYFDSAETVSKIVMNRMTDIGDSLIYYYNGDTVSTLFEGKFYSALTQSNYITQFIGLYEVSGNKEYLLIARKIFNSLLILKDRGGVLHKTDGLVHIEEYPSSPVLWTLNGWITAVQNVYNLYKVLGDYEIKQFCIDNVKSIERLIPIYDFGSLKNTRYQLAGFYYIKIVVEGDPIDIYSAQYIIDEKESYDISLEIFDQRKSRWNYRAIKGILKVGNFYRIADSALFNVVGSLASSNTNNLSFELGNKGKSKVKLFMAQGEYSPLLTAMPTQKWELLTEIEMVNQDSFNFNLDVPMHLLENVVYPTNFKKVIGGKNYNAYHFIHIEKLTQILTWYDSSTIAEYVEKWKSYVEDWSDMEVYTSSNVEFVKYRSIK